MTQSRPLALITGASSGIGLEFARLLAADGYDLHLVSRDKTRLTDCASALRRDFSTHITTSVVDLANPRQVEQFVARLEPDKRPIDTLINNAGVGLTGEFATLPLDQQLAMIQLNVSTLTALSQAVLGPMLRRNQGAILHVASTAAFEPGPRMAVYYATKAYVLSLSEALWQEVRGTKVRITALCPGPTATGFQAQARLGRSRLFQNGGMDVTIVARAGYQALKQGRRVIVPGWTNWLASWLVRFLPRPWVLRGIDRLHRPRS